MKHYIQGLIPVLAAVATTAGAAERTSANDRTLARYLKQNLDADADGDGVLTHWEHAQHLPKGIIKRFAKKARHEHADIPLRDGHTLPQESASRARGHSSA